MNDLQIRMIENQAAAIAVDALNSGDLMIRQLADDALALVAEVKALRAKLDAVRKYTIYYGDWLIAGNSRRGALSFDEWCAATQNPDTDTSADGLVIPDDGGDE